MSNPLPRITRLIDPWLSPQQALTTRVRPLYARRPSFSGLTLGLHLFAEMCQAPLLTLSLSKTPSSILSKTRTVSLLFRRGAPQLHRCRSSRILLPQPQPMRQLQHQRVSFSVLLAFKKSPLNSSCHNRQLKHRQDCRTLPVVLFRGLAPLQPPLALPCHDLTLRLLRWTLLTSPHTVQLRVDLLHHR